MVKVSQFYKTILLLVLAIGLFFGLKSLLPNRLFPETTGNDASMLIDSALLDAVSPVHKIEIRKTVIYSYNKKNNTTKITEKIDTLGTMLIENPKLASTKITIKPFNLPNFTKKLERRKPTLFLPDKKTNLVIQKPIVDTLLDPTISVQGYGYLQRFFSKLNKLEQNGQGRARVAYFGDSMNDGDLIVQDFRAMLQDKFGGYGVGFVSITSMSAASRASVYHQYSDNWSTQSFVSVRSPSSPFGVDGQVFLGQNENSYWVSYAAGGVKNSSALYNPTLFYGHSDNEEGEVNVSVNKGEPSTKELTPKYALNTLNLGVNHANSIDLNFSNIEGIPMYGLNFSSHSGVHVDNFSLRGNSGLPLSGLNTGLMNAFDRVLKYDLVILHYGTNVLNYGSLDYSWYEKNMVAVIDRLRYCFPSADILVISTADKSSKIDMQMTTDPAVVSLVRAQKNFSRDVGAGFIDLYNLMGGKGSMVEWVNGDMANKDYTHFNTRGSRQVGSLLFDELQRGYNKYKTQLETIKKGQEQNK